MYSQATLNRRRDTLSVTKYCVLCTTISVSCFLPLDILLPSRTQQRKKVSDPNQLGVFWRDVGQECQSASTYSGVWYLFTARATGTPLQEVSSSSIIWLNLPLLKLKSDWLYWTLGAPWITVTVAKKWREKIPCDDTIKRIRVRCVHDRDQPMTSRDSNPRPWWLVSGLRLSVKRLTHWAIALLV